MKKLFLLCMLLVGLVSCSSSKDEPSTRLDADVNFSSVYGKSVVGIWQIVDIRNEYNGAVNWENYQEYYGEIFLSFNEDGTCSTDYIGCTSDFIIEREAEGLTNFPYIFHHYVIERNNIRCYDPNLSSDGATLFEVESITDDMMEVVLQEGMYCMLSSASQPQLRMKWKKVNKLP